MKEAMAVEEDLLVNKDTVIAVKPATLVVVLVRKKTPPIFVVSI